MCQFKYEGKQIKLLPLKPKTGQPMQTSTLDLLPTPPSPHVITIAPFLSPTSHAYPGHKPLSPSLLTPSQYKALESTPTFAYINTCTNYTKRSMMEINRAM